MSLAEHIQRPSRLSESNNCTSTHTPKGLRAVPTVLVGSEKGAVGMKQLDERWRGQRRDGGRTESICFTLEIMNL